MPPPLTMFGPAGHYRRFVQDKSMNREAQITPFNISAVERDTGFSKDVLAHVGAALRVPQAGPRRQRRAPVQHCRRRQAARNEAADGRWPAPRQDHRAFAARAQRHGGLALAAAPRRPGSRDRARRARHAHVARRRCALGHPGEPADAPGAAALRPRHGHAAQPRRGRRVDARRAAGVRGASVHRAAARRAAGGDQRVPAPDGQLRACSSRRSRPSTMGSAC